MWRGTSMEKRERYGEIGLRDHGGSRSLWLWREREGGIELSKRGRDIT